MSSTFRINGKPFTANLTDLPADITLNTFIREHANLSGTKFMCQEGGCGVCICVVTGKNPATEKIQTWAVNSCLTLLNLCRDWDITTIEGLGNKHEGYHVIQRRLAKMNGTQCGYCTPGFVMNMVGLLASKEGNKLSMAEIENSFGGNICRCTGYRPILDAMKSFAADSNIEVPAECQDIEDLSSKLCPKTGSLCNGTCNGVVERAPLIYADGSQWYWPTTLDDLFAVFDQLKNDKYILVAGNTAHGVYRRSLDIQTYIDVNKISELRQYSINSDSLVLGANLTLTEAMDVFEAAAKKPGFEYCKQLFHHFDLIANVPIRNMGTLAGNIAIKHEYKDFPSDVFVVFEALDTQVVINESAIETKTVSLANYLKSRMSKKVVKSFVLSPYPTEKFIFDSYKIMPRAQNSHAYVNAAFLFNIERPNYKVVSARICFGGINPDFVHASALEQLLVGKNLFDTQQVEQIFKGFQLSYLKADTILSEPSPEYREKLAYNLLYKLLLNHAPAGKIPHHLVSGASVLKRPVSHGKQLYEPIASESPVAKPTTKVEALIQTSGEALYANDLPPQPGQLWAAFVTAKKIGATVSFIDASAALKIPGVAAFFTSKDIPGQNSIVGKDEHFFPTPEELFLTGTIKFYNQPVGVIVAKTLALAHRAAELVKITYSGGSCEVMPSMEDVLNHSCLNRIKHHCKSPIEELKLSETYDYTASGKLDMGLQYHFFMEPQTTVIVPSEGGLQVYAATQWMDLTQVVIANLLKIKNNEVQLKVRRLGGGYRGKATQGSPGACAAALAAFKLNRTVRFVQSLESMMSSSGKRWACHVDYDFYANKSGKIVGIRCKFYEDAGYGPNEAPMGHTVLLSKNCYEFTDNYKLDGYMVLSDSPSNTACRAPGSVEGIALIENIVEHIAFMAQLDPVNVRMVNIVKGHKMGEMLPRFVESTNYRQRKQEIAAFNENNRWRKKGLGIAVMEYHMGYFGSYPATVAIYHSDGTVVISHGGIEMGQGMNTKIIQVAAHILDIPIELIRVEGSDTVNGANGMVTGGSVGSESICFAVQKCCNILNQRLKPVKESIKDSDWAIIITEAYNRKINLIVSDECKQTDMDPYTVCGLALTEVEVDILTGNYLVQRVDILEDAGESLNPSVDFGQIEGAFMMGLGYWTSERIVVDKATGEMKTNRTWNYKPPGAKDIPIDFRIELLPQSSNTAGFMRSKGSVEGIALIENIVEHIAFMAQLDPVNVRMVNIVKGHKMGEMLPRFVESTNYRQRKQEIAAFNENNRWRKKGLGIAVMEYHMGYFGSYPATVAIYHSDGTVVISHGGIEMGQGMNTKIIQVAAHILDIPIELIRVEGSDTVNGANGMVTGGSVGSESICFAVQKCCNILNQRLKPVKESIKDSDWAIIITEAYNRKINLIVSDECKQTDMDPYTVCGLALTEVEVDILTGNYLVQRVDILEDAGESLNPSVDFGQIEGAFMMGLGYWTSERIVVDKATGEMKTNRTWNYKPPGAKDIPIDFRIELLPQSSNTAGFMRSKATGEPAICLAVSVAFALQEALQSARTDAGLNKSWVPLNAPMTPEHVLLNSGTDISMLKLQ